MTPAFEKAVAALKQLPGLGYRSAERLALHLLIEKPEALHELSEALREASEKIEACPRCGNLSEGGLCAICADERREQGIICVVERVPDLVAMERSAAYRGVYHILQGKLSPLQGIGPEDLNMASLAERIASGDIHELILALSNDIEGEATCHYIQETLIGDREITVTRIGFGLPSGGGVTYADSATLRSALEGRRRYE
jgi:recombination protein RecR